MEIALFKRFHLFEFEDLGWFPKFLRSYITDLLTYQINHFKIYEPLANKFRSVFKDSKTNTIVDLCSGSGGPVIQICTDLKTENPSHKGPQSLYLTDKYPNSKILKNIKDGFVFPLMSSIDARSLPRDLRGFRTMFTAFHHFKPRDAKEILGSAVADGDPIGVFEITERSFASLLVILIGPVTALYFTFFVRPVTLGRLFWTFVIPIVPLLYTWDGLVSNLRSYSPEELYQMAHAVDRNKEFVWEVGKVKSKFHVLITYLIGKPKRKTTRKRKQIKKTAQLNK